MENKEINIWGNKIILSDKRILKCSYRDNDIFECLKEAEWEHRNNNYYCNNHHEIINLINKSRQQEFIIEFKEKIKKLIFDY